MTVYVDEFPAGWGKWTGGGHLTTTDIDELHALAAKIGLRREWFQDKTFPHYDCQRRKRQLAIAAGAVEREFGSRTPPDTLVRCNDGGYETYGERMALRGAVMDAAQRNNPAEPEKQTPAPLHPATEAILRWFEFEHLPSDLRQISEDCHTLAHRMAMQLQHSPHGAEVTAGLRKLLEAKDCFVRAALN